MRLLRYEIPFTIEETTQKLRAQMKGQYRLESLLVLNKITFCGKHGRYGRIKQQKIWAVAVSGYDMFPRRFFRGTLQDRGGHTILEGRFAHSWALRIFLLLALAWVETPFYLGRWSYSVFMNGFISWLWYLAIVLIPGILKNKKNEQLVRTCFENLCTNETDCSSN